MSPLPLFLLQALILIAGPFAIWRLTSIRRGMPLVVLQILIGVLAGPTLLARFAPETFTLVFPASSLDRLSGISWLAAITFTFVTGLRLDISEFHGKGRIFFGIGLSSVIVPLIFGICVGAWVVREAPGLMGPNTNEAGFALAVGLATSATALPVLGAILRDTGLIKRALGRLALSYAALTDVLLWLSITALLSMSGNSGQQISGTAWTVSLMLLYFALAFFVVRPLLAWCFPLLHKDGHVRPGEIVLVTSTLLASALATEIIGLHYLIGAFTAGVIMPKPSKPYIIGIFEPLCVFVLLPFYFVVTGLKLTVDVEVSQTLLFFVLSIAAAMAGKVLGTTIPARMAGYRWRNSIQLGILLQSKGFVEVVILGIFLDAGLISRSAFSALILMALITTALTMPAIIAFDRLHTGRKSEDQIGFKDYAYDKE